MFISIVMSFVGFVVEMASGNVVELWLFAVSVPHIPGGIKAC